MTVFDRLAARISEATEPLSAEEEDAIASQLDAFFSASGMAKLKGALIGDMNAALGLATLRGRSVLMAVSPKKVVVSIHEAPLGTNGRWFSSVEACHPALALVLAHLDTFTSPRINVPLTVPEVGL